MQALARARARVRACVRVGACVCVCVCGGLHPRARQRNYVTQLSPLYTDPCILTKAHLLALRLTEELQLGQGEVERDLGVGEVAVVEGGAVRLVLLDGLVRVRVGVMLGIGLGSG